MEKHEQLFLKHLKYAHAMIAETDVFHDVNTAFPFALVTQLKKSVDGRLSVDDLKYAYSLAMLIGTGKDRKLEQLISEVVNETD